MGSYYSATQSVQILYQIEVFGYIFYVVFCVRVKMTTERTSCFNVYLLLKIIKFHYSDYMYLM